MLVYIEHIPQLDHLNMSKVLKRNITLMQTVINQLHTH